MQKILIVIDMQNDFVTGSLGSEAAQVAAKNIAAHINEYDTVIFTRDTHGPDYLDTLEGKFLPVPHCIKDTEGWEIGKALGIPDEFIFKAPEDGLSGKTDEDNLGFTYDELDNFLLRGDYPSYDVYKNIEERHKRNLHKVKPMPSCPRYYSTRDWEV